MVDTPNGAVSPVDHRYSDEGLTPYLSKQSFLDYKLRVERAVLEELVARDVCPPQAVDNFNQAMEAVSQERVDALEEEVRHETAAIVLAVKREMPTEFQPYVHLGVTSSDIIDTADALRLKEAIRDVVFPLSLEMMRVLLERAEEEAETAQVGRTHGRYAEATTFGFHLASHLDRFGAEIERLKTAVESLTGQISGPVGAYTQQRSFLDDPREFERGVLDRLGLEPGKISRQIVHPEPRLHVLQSLVSAWGVLANLADDLRHLMRSEIGEVHLETPEKQIGSSSMPSKANPVPFESTKSSWKAFVPRIQTSYMDQISEHQRDLTSSLSSRFTPEILIMFTYATRRMKGALERLQVDGEALEQNLNDANARLWTGPLSAYLASHGVHESRRLVEEVAVEAEGGDQTWWEAASGFERIRKLLDDRGLSPSDLPDELQGSYQPSKHVEDLTDSWRDRRSELEAWCQSQP